MYRSVRGSSVICAICILYVKCMSNVIKILFIGDIVGKPGRRATAQFLAEHKKADGIDFVIANGENLAGGTGITFDTYTEMIETGVDYFTSGNHLWDKAEFTQYLKDGSVKVLRPANYDDKAPGKGSVELEINGVKIVIVNLLGRVFIPTLVNDPFEEADRIIADHPDSIIILDFHAEATSEKVAMGYFLDGRAGAVIGTHTHVQTADETILPKGTAYISDAGMTGPKDSVLGVEKDIIIKSFLTGLPQSHKVASGEAIFSAVLIDFDIKTRKAVKIERLLRNYQ